MPWSVHMEFVVDKAALGQVYPRVLQFSPVRIIRSWLFILIHYLGDEQQALWWPQFRDIGSPDQHNGMEY
jgi:hypothetical protein